MPLAVCPWCDSSTRFGHDAAPLEVRCASCGQLFQVRKDVDDVPDIRRPDFPRGSWDDQDDDDFPRRRRSRPAPLFDADERADMRPPTGQTIGNLARILFGVCALIAATSIVLVFVAIMNDFSFRSGLTVENVCDALYVIGVLMAAISAIAWILFVLWIYRAYLNLIHMDVPGLDSPGLVVLCFFVPFVNLILPILHILALDRASKPADSRAAHRDWKGQGIDATIVAWWVFNILAILVGVAARFFFDPRKLPQNMGTPLIALHFMPFLVSRILAVPANILANSIIGQIIVDQRLKWISISGRETPFGDGRRRRDRD